MGEGRKTNLDFARGVAALAVCAGHLRAFQFVAFAQLANASIVDKVFYLVTGLGHQAVMVFFVLSGYFVAGSVADSISRQKWSWRGYGLRRLTRLWLVLVPALMMTLVWDAVGRRLTAGIGYDGRFSEILNSGPTTACPMDSTFVALIGNLFFLQTILTPVFGSNSPLWSLANEFWYYLMFPLAYVALRGRVHMPAKMALAALAIGIMLLLPKGVLTGFAIWLLGFGVYWVLNTQFGREKLGHPTIFAVSCLFFLASLWQSRAGGPLGADLMVGLAFAGMMPFLITRQPLNRAYCGVATALSEISYTLYVVHFPLFAFIFFVFWLPEKSAPSLLSYATFCCLVAVALFYAAALWWCFESRTDKVRKWAETRI